MAILGALGSGGRVPGTPTIDSVTPGSSRLTVNFTQPTFYGKSGTKATTLYEASAYREIFSASVDPWISGATTLSLTTPNASLSVNQVIAGHASIQTGTRVTAVTNNQIATLSLPTTGARTSATTLRFGVGDLFVRSATGTDVTSIAVTSLTVNPHTVKMRSRGSNNAYSPYTPQTAEFTPTVPPPSFGPAFFPPPAFSPPPSFASPPAFTPPPSFPPLFIIPAPFFPPSFPPFFFTGSVSIGSNTLVLTSSGYMKASDLDIGDELVSIEIQEIPLDGSMFNINDWESTSLTNNGFVTTTITNIVSRQVQSVIVINGDVFSENHMILTRKDGIHKFINTTEIDTSYEVFNYTTNSWNQVTSVNVLSNPTIVYSIDCEPYDMFFTNEMLVYNIKENK